jgi:hypothetical protein
MLVFWFIRGEAFFIRVVFVVVWFFAPTTFLKHHHSFSNPEIIDNYAVVELRIAWGRAVVAVYSFEISSHAKIQNLKYLRRRGLRAP